MNSFIITTENVNPNYLHELKVKHLIASLTLCLYILLGSLWYDIRNLSNTDGIKFWGSEAINAFLLLGVWLVYILILLKKQENRFSGFAINFTNDSFSIKTKKKLMENVPYQSIAFAIKQYTGEYTFYNLKGRPLYKLPIVEDNSGVLDKVINERIAKVITGPYPFIRRINYAIPYTSVAGFFTIVLCPTKLIAIICACAFALLSGYILFQNYKLLAQNKVFLAKRFGIAAIIVILILVFVLQQRLKG